MIMRKKVLVVEDSVFLHKMLDFQLKAYQKHQIEPHVATDGQEGLIKLNEHPDTDLILLDVNMPNMSGLEFLKRVRDEPAFDNIAVVLQSTEDQQSDIDRALQAGANGYLTKPFTPPQLYEILDKLLEGVSGEGSSGG